MKPARVIIVHGSFGNSHENWFPWLADELRQDGHEVITPDFPTPEGQSLTSWLEVFRRDAGQLTRDSILVGHSLGSGFILALLENASEPILATYLVSGFVGRLDRPEFDSVNETFVCRSFDWDTIRRNAGRVRVYNSDNDPYVPLNKGEEIASKLGVTLSIIHDGGHINASAGYMKFQPILTDVRTLNWIGGST
jgi:predicted alpha/beta hydrolase family esterase